MRTFCLPLHSSLRRTLFGSYALLSSLLLLTLLATLPVAAATQPSAAQQTATPQAAKPTPQSPKSSAATHKKVSAAHARKHAASKTAAKPVETPAQTAPAPVPVAPKPDWPVNNRPSPASIVWNASGLHIEASNSSLQQILKEVSNLTGATVEGLSSDERVYGVFGPAPARDVLARLLYGSRYNLVLIGDQGQGTPRRIVLSLRDAKSAPTAAGAKSTDDDADDEVIEDETSQDQDQTQHQQPPQPPVVRNSSNQPGPPDQQISNPGQPPQNPQQ
jgi:hypothetical protein